MFASVNNLEIELDALEMDIVQQQINVLVKKIILEMNVNLQVVLD